MRLYLRLTLLAAALATIAISALGPATPAAAATRFVDEVFANVTVTSNIAYGEAIDEFGQPETLRLDLYQPNGDTASNRPVIIFAHGGSFTGGDKAFPDPVNYSTRMTKRGYVVASINYRLREAGFPPDQQGQVVADAKHDMQAAIRWFRANAGTYAIDANRIAVAGYSAGAATALFAAYTADDPGDSGNPGYSSEVSTVVSISGGMGSVADFFIDPGEPPVQLIHGTNDATVPYSNATSVAAAATADGIYNEIYTLDGAGHSKFGPSLMPEIAQASANFLYEYLVNPAAVGGLTKFATSVAPPGESLSWTWWWLVPICLLFGPAFVWAEWYFRRRR